MKDKIYISYITQNRNLVAENLNLKRDLAASNERINDLANRLTKGIKYDEDLNMYFLVWSEREIEKAKEEAKEIMAKMHELPKVKK